MAPRSRVTRVAFKQSEPLTLRGDRHSLLLHTRLAPINGVRARMPESDSSIRLSGQSFLLISGSTEQGLRMQTWLYGHDRRCRTQGLCVGTTFLLAITAALASEPPPDKGIAVVPPDALIVAAASKLVKEEKTEAICLLVRDGSDTKNISEAVYSALKRKYPRVFECSGSSTTFVLGPLRPGTGREGTLEIRRVTAHSPCRYRATKRGEKWRLQKEPCITM